MSKCATVYPADCIIYTGPDMPELGLVRGKSTMQDVVDILLSQTSQESTDNSYIDDLIEQISSKTIQAESELFDIGNNKSLCGANIKQLGFNYGLEPLSGTVKFTYDVSDVEQNLPEGYKMLKKTVRALSQGSAVISAGGTVGSFEISHTRIPALVEMSYILTTPCGHVPLTASLSVLSTTLGGSYTGMLSVNSMSGSNFDSLTQQQYNEILAAEVSTIKREVFHKPDDLELDDTISSLESEVTTLKTDLSSANSKIATLESKILKLEGMM